MTFFNFRWKRQCIDFNINGDFVAPGKKIFINFSKAKTKFSLRLHYNRDKSYLFANEKKKYINLKLVI